MIYPKDFINKIICGDCLEVMKSIPDNSINFVLFSPPYDRIRDYKGFSFNFNLLGKEIDRVLIDGGICVMIIQDQTKNFKKSLTTFKTIVNWCENTSLGLFECCIYSRNGTPGKWWNTRFRVDHEYIPIFLKGKRPNYFNKKHLTIESKKEWKTSGISRLTSGELKRGQEKHIINTKTQGTIFNYANSSQEKVKDSKIKLQHPATYPDKLAEDFIKCFCPVGGIVLDPMCGSGTTCKMAQWNDRNFIGIEISPEYCKIAKERINLLKGDLR